MDTRRSQGAEQALREGAARIAIERMNEPRVGVFSYNVFTVSQRDLARLHELQQAFFRQLRAIVEQSHNVTKFRDPHGSGPPWDGGARRFDGGDGFAGPCRLPERHFRDSFITIRLAIARVLARWLPRCLVCDRAHAPDPARLRAFFRGT